MADPYQHFTADQIAAASACPVENVRQHWPRMVEQLGHCGINERPVQIALIGTTAIESASSFAPVREGFYLGEPEPASTYRKSLPYAPYFGRGFIQRTHESGYRAAGPAIAKLWGAGMDDPNFDLVTNPDNLLDPDMAAADAALFFRDTRALPTASWPQGYSLVDASRAADYDWVRRLVYGGADPKGTARVAQIAADLGTSPAALTYNPLQAPERQIQAWVCSIRATSWMLKSLGLPVDIGALQSEMSPRYVTEALGLLDARGYGIAEVLKSHLPAAYHQHVHVFESISWDELVSLAGSGPGALGLRGAYHWLNVAQRRSDGDLDSPNPAPNYPQPSPIGDVLTRAEFDKYGPASAVWVNMAAVAPPAPPPPPTPATVTRADLDAALAPLLALRERLPVA